MALTLPQGMEIKAEILPAYEDILTPEALALVAKLHRAFQPRRKELPSAVLAFRRDIVYLVVGRGPGRLWKSRKECG